MSFGALYRMNARQLRAFCLIFGIFFLGVALYVWLDGELQANEAEVIVLVPLVSGLVLFVGALALHVDALRALIVVCFVGFPGLFFAVNWVGCGLGWFSESWCQ